MLNLRAIWTCDQWNEFEKYWGERENARLYPYLESLSAMEWRSGRPVAPNAINGTMAIMATTTKSNMKLPRVGSSPATSEACANI
jgi:hypothetical protein